MSIKKKKEIYAIILQNISAKYVTVKFALDGSVTFKLALFEYYYNLTNYSTRVSFWHFANDVSAKSVYDRQFIFLCL